MPKGPTPFVPRPPVTEAGGIYEEPRVLQVRGARLCPLFRHMDARGILTVGESGEHLPFIITRYFAVTDVPPGVVRGNHAHRELEEFLVCLKGSCRVALQDGHSRDEVLLASAAVGLFVPALLWITHFDYSSDAVLLVLASARYAKDDYIHDFDEFLRMTAER